MKKTMSDLNATTHNIEISNNSNRKKKDETKPLPIEFHPGPMDVIIAKGKTAFRHPGNRLYRKIIQSNLPQYSTAKFKSDKSRIVSKTMDSIREASSSGVLFVRHNKKDGRWCEIGEDVSREKIGQSFRDLLHSRYSSSSKAKQLRRKNNQENMKSSTRSNEKASAEKTIPKDSDTNIKIELFSGLIPSCNPIFSKNKIQEPSHSNLFDADKNCLVEHSFCSNYENEPIPIDQAMAHRTIPKLLSENSSPSSSWDDDDEPIPIDQASMCCTMPIVSPENSFCFGSEEPGSYYCQKNVFGGTYRPTYDKETKYNNGLLQNKIGAWTTMSAPQLLLPSEPIPIEETAFESEYYREELLGAMSSLWE